jgi:hypothetical protein
MHGDHFGKPRWLSTNAAALDENAHKLGSLLYQRS